MTQTQHQAPPFSAQVSILNFEKVVRKKLVFGEDLDIDIISTAIDICLQGILCFLLKKDFRKQSVTLKVQFLSFLFSFVTC